MGLRTYLATGRLLALIWQPSASPVLQELPAGERLSLAALRHCLVPLSLFYGAGARGRRLLYRRGWRQPKRLPAPVVSVGNLTVGGTGKTPLTAWLARALQEQGQRVAILSRGYGGRRKSLTCLSDGQRLLARPPQTGDESFWLARTLPGVPVYTGPSRYEAGLAAWRAHRPDLFLLDDGFQHFQLSRDLDIVLLDAAAPFGNGLLLPAGPLREPVRTLDTAQVIILTRFDPQQHQSQLIEMRQRFPDKSILTAAVAPVGVAVHPGRESQGVESLQALPLYAFAGMANPQVFFNTLTALGVELQGRRSFPDHWAYTAPELQEMVRMAREAGAAGLITTSKDWARLGELWQGELPLWVLAVEIRLQQPDVLKGYLAALLDRLHRGRG
jgi:tetraacyldisaccharide 4'-kinase